MNHYILGCLTDFAYDASSVEILALPNEILLALSDEILFIFKDIRPTFLKKHSQSPLGRVKLSSSMPSRVLDS